MSHFCGSTLKAPIIGLAMPAKIRQTFYSRVLLDLPTRQSPTIRVTPWSGVVCAALRRLCRHAAQLRRLRCHLPHSHAARAQTLISRSIAEPVERNFRICFLFSRPSRSPVVRALRCKSQPRVLHMPLSPPHLTATSQGTPTFDDFSASPHALCTRSAQKLKPRCSPIWRMVYADFEAVLRCRCSANCRNISPLKRDFQVQSAVRATIFPGDRPTGAELLRHNGNSQGFIIRLQLV